MKRHCWAIVLLAVLLISGLAIVCDYGISWDEEFQRDYGFHVYQYVHEGDPELLEYRSRYHGPAFQYVLYLAEHLVGPTDPGDVYRLRHVITFLFSVVGAGFFYLLLLEMFRKRSWALLGMALLVLSPRIFAHSFYNSKDASFMYMFIIAMYTMVLMLRNLNWRTAIAHAFACAWLMDIRILGAFVPIFTGILILPRFFWSFNENLRKVPQLLLFVLLILVGMVAFWPTLWHAPLEELMNATVKMRSYPWGDPVRFMGAFYSPRDLPWFYLPWWIIITTPLIHLALIAVGAVVWIFTALGIRPEHRVAVLIWAVLPLWVITNQGATVYDGWRHLYFIWPSFVILAVAGASWLMQRLEVHLPSALVWAVLLLGCALPLQWIVRNHPYQAVYFNALAGKDAGLDYEMDYWGGSYRQALEWLVANFPDGDLLICPAHFPGHLNQRMLLEQDHARLRNMPLDEADFFISNYRFPRELDSFIEKRWPYERPLYQIEVDGNAVVGVYDVRE
ncbi:MAG: hypothetical protein K9J06_05740 [Flavobacteriales bacterium]|nr:hypothetical protein [Flavobacteriales bacterium]